MTPTQKTESLIKLFYKVTSKYNKDFDFSIAIARHLDLKSLNKKGLGSILIAKECALICVDEMIAVFDNLVSHYSDDFLPAKEYWQNVRKEIELM